MKAIDSLTKKKSTIKRFLEPALYEWKSVLNLVLFDGMWAFLGAGVVRLTQYFVRAIEQQDTRMFYISLGLILLAGILKFVFSLFRKPPTFIVWRNLWDRIDALYMPKIIQGDNTTFEAIGTGRLIAIFSKGGTIRGDLITKIFGNGVQSLVLFLFFLITVGMKDINMFYGILFSLLLVVGWWRLYGFRSFVYRKEAKDAAVDLSRLQVRWFMNKFEIVQQNKIDYELQRRFDINNRWYQSKYKEKFWQGVSFDGSHLIVIVLFVVLIGYTGLQVLSGNFAYSDLVVIIGLGTAFLTDLDSLLRDIRTIVDKRIDVEKLRNLTDSLEHSKDLSAGEPFDYKQGDIELKDVSFGYAKENPIFDGFSLTISGSKKTALVGSSGSGKSTLVKLISGYIFPQQGAVLVDDQNLEDVSLQSFYRHIGYLTQEPSVFDGTILDNLTYGRTDVVSDGNELPGDLFFIVENALRLAHCDFVYDLPKGIHTEIGERGVRLSGGQRQRLAIAKVFLKDPKIILLDEPTSALDSFSEEAISAAMHNLFEGRTVIIIAHRLQTVKHADDIIVIENGQICERGVHDELVEQGGVYAKMLELQSGF